MVYSRLQEFYFEGNTMRTYVCIMLGGALGAVSRNVVANLPMLSSYGPIHLGTVLVNVAGCFVLAFFLTAISESLEIDADVQLAVSTGFLGAFTTFSTLCKDVVSSLASGAYASVVVYLLASIVLSFLAVSLGVFLARTVFAKVAETGLIDELCLAEESESE